MLVGRLNVVEILLFLWEFSSSELTVDLTSETVLLVLLYLQE